MRRTVPTARAMPGGTLPVSQFKASSASGDEARDGEQVHAADSR